MISLNRSLILYLWLAAAPSRPRRVAKPSSTIVRDAESGLSEEIIFEQELKEAARMTLDEDDDLDDDETGLLDEPEYPDSLLSWSAMRRAQPDSDELRQNKRKIGASSKIEKIMAVANNCWMCQTMLKRKYTPKAHKRHRMRRTKKRSCKFDEYLCNR